MPPLLSQSLPATAAAAARHKPQLDPTCFLLQLQYQSDKRGEHLAPPSRTSTVPAPPWCRTVTPLGPRHTLEDAYLCVAEFQGPEISLQSSSRGSHLMHTLCPTDQHLHIEVVISNVFYRVLLNAVESSTNTY
ncbi:hypothetical protein EJB05_14139, partial [Eragrostis curvula]